MKTYTTAKGTALPLMALKGKDYMQVAYRIQWFVEENQSYNIETNFLKIDEAECVAHTSVTIFDQNGRVVRRATGTKKETKADFGDYVEKAETGSLGRALISMGYGTQYALADLDEGHRIIDSPLEGVTKEAKAEVKKPSFKKPTIVQAEKSAATSTAPVATAATNAPATDDGWQ